MDLLGPAGNEALSALAARPETTCHAMPRRECLNYVNAIPHFLLTSPAPITELILQMLAT